jgi:hypothetical protein
MKKLRARIFIMTITFLVFPIFVKAQTTTPTSTSGEVSEVNYEKYLNDVSSTLDKARQAAKTASATAGIVKDVYGKTSGFFSELYGVIGRGQEVFQRLKPILDKILNVWNVVTNNNEPIRVFITVSLLVVGVVITRRFV